MSRLEERLIKIASKLEVEGLTRANYTIDKARDILMETCLPTALIRMLQENEKEVINLLPE